MYLPNLWINMSDYLNLREGKFPIKIDKFDINYLATNKDYSPFAKEREKDYIKICNEKNIEYISELYYSYFNLNFQNTTKNPFY